MGYYGSFGQTTTGTLPSGSGSATTTTTAPSGSSAPPPGSLQSWSYAPIIIAAMQQNYGLITAPRGQKEAWHAFAVQLIVSMGYCDPGRETDAQGAVYALAQAYGYYWQPGTLAFQKLVQADQQERMLNLLNFDLSAINAYKTAHPPVAPGVRVSASDLRRMWAAKGILPGATPPAAPPPAPASSSPWLLLGGVAVIGAAAYFLV
jgi:hypothetical protein